MSDDVVPLPEIIVGALTDDQGNPLSDETGAKMVGTPFDAILSAIYALAKEIRTMSETISQQIDASTAAITADIAALATAIGMVKDEIAALHAALIPGATVTQDQADKLAAVHTMMTAQVAALQALEPAPPAA